MTESFLHYIWQFQYFNKADLLTTEGEALQVFHPGNRNVHAGPDFSEARIKIATLEWRGSIEIHIKASGWTDHAHDTDEAYEKVVLHVVWENDRPIQRTDGSVMPTLELKDLVDLSLWNRYKKLFTSVNEIPCAAQWANVADITKLSMLDKAVAQRLETKAGFVLDQHKDNRGDWEETCYQLLCKNFGFKVNAEAMQQLARQLPFKVVKKHANSIQQVEALLLGQAGFLEKIKPDEYTRVLIQEYHLLSKKFGLEVRQMKAVQWRFLRMRPANFPTVRLAQLAAVLSLQKNLFSKIIETTSSGSLIKLFNVEQSPYWREHYQPGKKAKGKVPGIGKSAIQNIVINTVAPVLAAYGKLMDDQVFVDRAVDVLQAVPAENNAIIRQWKELGYCASHAFDSQGLIELYNSYCIKRKCLDCAIGSSIVTKA